MTTASISVDARVSFRCGSATLVGRVTLIEGRRATIEVEGKPRPFVRNVSFLAPAPEDPQPRSP